MNDNFDLRKYLSKNPLLIKESMDFETAKKKAEEESKNGYIVHVNRASSHTPDDDAYVLSDWYDNEKTDASYENGRKINESKNICCTRQSRLQEAINTVLTEKKKQTKNILKPKKSKSDNEDLDFDIDVDDTTQDNSDNNFEDNLDIDMNGNSSSIEKSAGMSKEQTEIQKSLKTAYDNAISIGDEKLATQIGNSLTYFMKTHILNRAQ